MLKRATSCIRATLLRMQNKLRPACSMGMYGGSRVRYCGLPCAFACGSLWYTHLRSQRQRQLPMIESFGCRGWWHFH